MLLSALAVIVGVCWQKRRPEIALGALCAGQLLLSFGLVPTSSEPWQPGEPDPNKRIAFINEPWDLKFGLPVSMPPNVPAALRLHDIAGYDSLMDMDTRRLLTEINGQDPAPLANGNIMFIKPGADYDLLAASGVTEVWKLDDYTLGAKGKLVKQPLEGPGRASIEGRPARITHEGFTYLTVEATGPGTLVVRDRNLAGWSASDGGQPLEIKEGFWREVELSEGSHTVKFTYAPPGLSKGLAFFGFGVLACITGFVRSRPKKEEKPSQ